MFLIPLENYAQECATVSSPPGVLNFNCTKISTAPEDLQNTPIKIVKVNFHWVTNQKDQNFTPDGSNGTINGNDVAQKWVDLCNGDLATIPTNPLYPDPNKNFVGDSHIRYEIYTDPNNDADKHGGVWYWRSDFKDNDINSYPYKDGVLNIVMHDNGPAGANGQAFIGSSRIYLFNVQEEFYAQTTNIFFYPKVINHELGHMCNLEQHSFENSPCNGIDLDQSLECNIQPSGICSNGTTVSNNMMGYNDTERALSPCQWQRFYGFLTSSPEKWIKSTPCDALVQNADIVIDGNTETVWDKVRFLNANITVRTGSQLTLECKLFLGPDKRIIVERGAKFYVNSGTISSICEEPWDGIHVHGNVNEPQPDYSTNYKALKPDEAGVVYIRNASLLENAHVPISTDAPGMSYADQVQRWGGVVRVEDSHFKNNKKVAAFMKYPLKGFIKNKSSFYHNRITVDNPNIIDPIGITIWDTHGILFSNNTFEKGLRQCIYGIDYSTIVNNKNDFYDVGNAHIFMEATTPGGLGEETAINDNTFRSTGKTTPYGILSLSDDNAPRTLSITNNKFLEKIRIAVKVNNATPLRATGNVFNQTGSLNYSIDLNNTSENSDFASIVNCNIFNTTQMGLRLQNDNKGLYFPGNTFNNGGRDINISSSTSSSLAKVGKTQCWAQLDAQQNIDLKDYPSSNAFKSLAARIIAKADVEKFTYYTPPVAKKAMFAEYFPDNKGQSFDLNEYDKDPVLNCAKVTVASTSPPGNLPPPCTTVRVITVREQLSKINQQITKDQTDSPLAFEREFLQTDLYENIRCISVRYLDEGNSVAAEDFLLAQPEPSFKRTAYSLRIKRGDYEGARELLHSLPITSEYDTEFKQIQDINLKRYDFERQYELSGAEEAFLTEVSNTGSVNSGYAHALLDLLVGYREYNEDDASYRSLKDYTKDQIKANTRKEMVFVSPNPVQDDVVYIFTKDTKVTNGKVQLTNLLGQVSYEKSFRATAFDRVVVDIPYLEPGLYAIRVTDGDLVLYESKISILK